MRIQQEFSRYAGEYKKYNKIQELVADRVLQRLIPQNPKSMLDIGCGSGAIFQRVDWEVASFTGIDFSHNMLEGHPLSEKTQLICGDFNDDTLFETLKEQRFECIVSSSALQWAKDFDRLFKNLVSLNAPLNLALFTSNTFKTLYQLTGLSPVIGSQEAILAAAGKYCKIDYEIVHYKLAFDSNIELFRYIKRSGVSGGRGILDFKRTKELIRQYPLDYLEFEVIFINSFSKV
jgi:malonyl-CoA O-methyltransferase